LSRRAEAAAAPADERPLITGRLVREAFSRGAIFGSTLVLTALVMFGLAHLIVPRLFTTHELVFVTLALFALGFVATPLAIVERVALRHPPTWRRDGRTVAASGLVSVVAGSILLLQLVYANEVLQDGGSLEAAGNALDHMWEHVKSAFDRPGNLVRLVVLLGVPACPTVVGRVHGWGLGRQLGFVAGTTFFLNFVVLVAWDPEPTNPGSIPQVAAVTALLAALTPVLFRWADATEALWARALGHEPD
jgi:hypothetical protein